MDTEKRLYDYEPKLVTATEFLKTFCAGRGNQATQIAGPYDILARTYSGRIDKYYQLKNKKAHFYHQSGWENFMFNLARVGFLGCFERSFSLLGSFSAQHLAILNPVAAVKKTTYSIRNRKLRFRGTEFFVAQFYLTHCLAAKHAQEISPSGKFVEVNPLKYLSNTFIYSWLTFPLQILRMEAYTFNKPYTSSSNFFKTFSAAKIPSYLTAHLHFSLGWTFLVGGMAYFGSKDWGKETLALPPLAMMYYLFSVQSGNIYRGLLKHSFDIKTLNVWESATKTRVGMGLGAAFVMLSVFCSFRFAGLRDQGSLWDEFVHENEATYISKDFYNRTRQFYVTEQFNRKRSR